MSQIDLAQLWTVASVLGGFQVAAFAWRINRELHMEEEGYQTWLTIADYIVVLSFLVLAFGVFAAPIFGVATPDLAARLFGLSLIMFGSSAFVLAGHYNLYFRKSWVKYTTLGERAPRGPRTNQELLGCAIALLVLGVYVFWWILI